MKQQKTEHRVWKHRKLIEKMTLEEKAALLSGKGEWQTWDFERLGIPSMYCSDGPHGLRKQAGAGDHLGLIGGQADCGRRAGKEEIGRGDVGASPRGLQCGGVVGKPLYTNPEHAHLKEHTH